jgi:hypothetical protein
VQEVGRESRGREQDYSYAGNRPWLHAHPTSDECVPQLKKPGGGSSNPRGSASRRERLGHEGVQGVQQDSEALGWMLRSEKRMPRRY